MANVVLTQKARTQLSALLEYYRTLGQLRKGMKTRTAILKKALLLRQFPLMGQEDLLLSEAGRPNYRYLAEGHFKIIYRFDGENVFLISVFDSRQSPEKML